MWIIYDIWNGFFFAISTSSGKFYLLPLAKVMTLTLKEGKYPYQEAKKFHIFQMDSFFQLKEWFTLLWQNLRWQKISFGKVFFYILSRNSFFIWNPSGFVYPLALTKTMIEIQMTLFSHLKWQKYLYIFKWKCFTISSFAIIEEMVLEGPQIATNFPFDKFLIVLP